MRAAQPRQKVRICSSSTMRGWRVIPREMSDHSWCRHVRKRLGDIETRVVSLVEQFLRSHPTVTRRDPALGAAVVVHAVEALTHKLVVHESPAVPAAAYVDEMVDLVMAYLTAGASPPARAPRVARRVSRA